jgi:hypothetical protein
MCDGWKFRHVPENKDGSDADYIGACSDFKEGAPAVILFKEPFFLASSPSGRRVVTICATLSPIEWPTST